MLIVVRSHDFKYKKKWFWFKCLQRWDEVDIQEETEDGKKIKSKIQVPMQVIICSYKEGKLYLNLAATLQIWTFNLFLKEFPVISWPTFVLHLSYIIWLRTTCRTK